MQNTEAELLPAACRNTLPKLKYQTKRASQHPQHEEKVVDIHPGGGTATTRFPCLLYFHLGSSQFDSLCVLSCKTSPGHPWGKLGTRHLLQLVITWLGFVTGASCRLTPGTCFRGTEVCCLPGLSSFREAARGCKWQMLTDTREPGSPASPLPDKLHLPRKHFSVQLISQSERAGRPSSKGCVLPGGLFSTQRLMPATAILKVSCYLLLTLHKTRQDHPEIRLEKYYTRLWAGVPEIGPGSTSTPAPQLREHKGINNLDSVRDKTNLRNNSPIQTPSEF